MEEEETLCGGEKKTERDLNFEIRVVILQPEEKKKREDLCLSAPPEEAGSEAGRAAIAFHWQADKQGAAWRQKGHYQRLGQTEIRASFGPGRQASTHTHIQREGAKERKRGGWKLHCGKTGVLAEALCTLEMPIMKCSDSSQAVCLESRA